MKQTGLYRFVMLFFVAALIMSGCRPAKRAFSFSYELEETAYSAGDTVKILVTVQNIGRGIEINEPLENYFGAAQLSDNTGVVLFCNAMIYLPAEYEDVFETSQSICYTYSFDIPNNMSAGSLDLLVSFMDEVHIFEDVLAVSE